MDIQKTNELIDNCLSEFERMHNRFGDKNMTGMGMAMWFGEYYAELKDSLLKIKQELDNVHIDSYVEKHNNGGQRTNTDSQ